MAGQKETPRQRMISMMYLVLTAMLALNVSKDVLTGFQVVNDSVVLTNQNFTGTREGAYANLEKEYMLNEIEVGPFWEKAKEAMRLSADMVSYIENLRDELIATTEGIPIDSARTRPFDRLKKKDDYTNPTRFMIGKPEDGSNGRARALKNRLIAYKDSMFRLIGPKYRDKINLGLETEGDYRDAGGQKLNWELHHFYDIPLAADIPILNKFISEVNNAELEVVNGLLRESIEEDFKYDRIEAKVLPTTDYLFTGDEYEAEVIVAAYDTSHSPSPSVFVLHNADTLPLSKREEASRIAREGGRLMVRFPVTGLGQHRYAGFVSVPTNSGRERTYHFSTDYFVAQPSVTVSPVNMNVLYVGVENPLSISVSGVAAENVFPVLSRGTLKPGQIKGNWIAIIPGDVREVSVAVSANINGGMKPMGAQQFRVKPIPDPEPFIANKKDGFVDRESIISAGKIVTLMPKDFEFNFTFKVQSFKMSMQRGFEMYHYTADSENLTTEMLREIQRTNRGQIIVFEDIVVKGPEGANRTIEPLVLVIR